MKKNIRRSLGLMIALLLVGCVFTLSVGAAGQTWTDDFAGDKGGNYDVYGYWWNMEGQLKVGDPNAVAGWCYYYLKDMTWNNFVMEFDVENQANAFGVVLRAGDPGPGPDQGDGIAVMYDGNWAFFGLMNGAWHPADEQIEDKNWATPVEGKEWPVACQPGGGNNHWKIVAEEDMIKVYFNNAQEPSMAIATDYYKSGAIGFRALNAGGQITAIVKNLSITETVEEEVPPTEPKTPDKETDETGKPENPHTGDVEAAAIFFVLAAASAVVLAATRVCRRNANR